MQATVIKSRSTRISSGIKNTPAFSSTHGSAWNPAGGRFPEVIQNDTTVAWALYLRLEAPNSSSSPGHGQEMQCKRTSLMASTDGWRLAPPALHENWQLQSKQETEPTSSYQEGSPPEPLPSRLSSAAVSGPTVGSPEVSGFCLQSNRLHTDSLLHSDAWQDVALNHCPSEGRRDKKKKKLKL